MARLREPQLLPWLALYTFPPGSDLLPNTTEDEREAAFKANCLREMEFDKERASTFLDRRLEAEDMVLGALMEAHEDALRWRGQKERAEQKSVDIEQVEQALGTTLTGACMSLTSGVDAKDHVLLPAELVQRLLDGYRAHVYVEPKRVEKYRRDKGRVGGLRYHYLNHDDLEDDKEKILAAYAETGCKGYLDEDDVTNGIAYKLPSRRGR